MIDREKVARAMKPQLFDGGADECRGPVTRYERDIARQMADAAIAAVLAQLREPTPEMLKAYWRCLPSPYEQDMEDEAAATRHIQAMLDAVEYLDVPIVPMDRA